MSVLLLKLVRTLAGDSLEIFQFTLTGNVLRNDDSVELGSDWFEGDVGVWTW